MLVANVMQVCFAEAVVGLQMTNRLWQKDNKNKQPNNFPCPDTDPELKWDDHTYVVQIKPLVRDIISIWSDAFSPANQPTQLVGGWCRYQDSDWLTHRTHGIFSTECFPNKKMTYSCKPNNGARAEEHVLQLVWLQEPLVCHHFKIDQPGKSSLLCRCGSSSKDKMHETC